MESQRIKITAPTAMVSALDRAAREACMSRAATVRDAIARELKRRGLWPPRVQAAPGPHTTTNRRPDAQ